MFMALPPPPPFIDLSHSRVAKLTIHEMRHVFGAGRTNRDGADYAVVIGHVIVAVAMSTQSSWQLMAAAYLPIHLPITKWEIGHKNDRINSNRFCRKGKALHMVKVASQQRQKLGSRRSGPVWQ